MFTPLTVQSTTIIYKLSRILFTMTSSTFKSCITRSQHLPYSSGNSGLVAMATDTGNLSTTQLPEIFVSTF